MELHVLLSIADLDSATTPFSCSGQCALYFPRRDQAAIWWQVGFLRPRYISWVWVYLPYLQGLASITVELLT